MKKILILAIMTMLGNGLKAQQDAGFSQYMFNGLVVNPAYAGSKPYISSALLYRKQWVDFPGSPLTQSFFIHGPLKNRKVGLGFSFVNDHVGVTNQTEFYGSYAYHINTGKGHVSLGLQGGISYYNVRLSDLKIWDGNDEVFTNNIEGKALPNFGAGIYYYASKFYMGLAVPRIINNSLENPYVVRATHTERHYFITGGYVIEVNRDFKVKPSFLMKYVEGAPVQVDLNLNFLLQNLIWVGGSYRSGDSFIGIFELQLSRRMRLGYAYDFTFTKLANYSNGTHELMLGFDFGYDILKMKTPRYF